MKNESDVRRFWTNVYGVLLQRDLTVGDLAKHLGVSYNIIPNWRSKNRYPQFEYLEPMAEFLGVSLDYLITGKESRPVFTPRINAVANCLMQDEDRLDAVEILLFGKSAGQLSVSNR